MSPILEPEAVWTLVRALGRESGYEFLSWLLTSLPLETFPIPRFTWLL